MVSNAYRRAYEVVTTKMVGEMNADEIELVGRTSAFMANILPRIEPQYDELLISRGLLRLAEIMEGG